MPTGISRIARCFAVLGMSVSLLAQVPSGAYAQSVNFSGFFIGGHAGSAKGTMGAHDVTTPFSAWTNVADGNFSFSDRDTVWGLQGGYQHQFGMFVLGGELGYTFGGPRQANKQSPYVPWHQETFSADDGVLLLSGRIGVAIEAFHIYGRLGYGRTDVEFIATDLGFPVNGYRQKATLDGFAYGAGIEYLAHPNWIVALDYTRLDLGSETGSGVAASPASVGTFRLSSDVEVVTFRLNYRIPVGAALLK